MNKKAPFIHMKMFGIVATYSALMLEGEQLVIIATLQITKQLEGEQTEITQLEYMIYLNISICLFYTVSLKHNTGISLNTHDQFLN